LTLTDLLDRLAAHKTLGSAPREELQWLVAHGTLQQLGEGDRLTEKGQPVSSLFVILSGHISFYVDRAAGRHKLLDWQAGDISGVLPYSRMGNAPGEAIAREPSEVLAIPRGDLTAMTRECHEITSLLVHNMLDRARVFTSSGLQDEKMISLGKLSAGIAHELNNPASSIERNASILEDRLLEAERATRSLAGSRLDDAQLSAIDALLTSCVSVRPQGVLTPIQQAEREDAIADWLADRKVGSELAGPLADTTVTIEALDRLAATVTGPALSSALRWVAAGCSVRGIASDIQEAASRIAGLVTAVKGFTHMDQAMVAEPVDLLSSLRNTVAVLNAKARSKSAGVTVTVEPNLPRVRGFIGELNQVWANLIDNALDAVPRSGRVDVTASREGGRVVVRVVDNGPGIPENIRNHVFEPFFTTKPVGQGTGLGLDIVRRLVQHNDAQIEVDTVPGRTEFRVSLPVADDESSGHRS
jgi:signal transduction histidine kinase